MDCENVVCEDMKLVYVFSTVGDQLQDLYVVTLWKYCTVFAPFVLLVKLYLS